MGLHQAAHNKPLTNNPEKRGFILQETGHFVKVTGHRLKVTRHHGELRGHFSGKSGQNSGFLPFFTSPGLLDPDSGAVKWVLRARLRTMAGLPKHATERAFHR